MVNLSVEMDHLFIFKPLFLDFLEGYGDVYVVHFEPFILLVIIFLFLKLFHEFSLLAKEHFLASTLNHDSVNFLW